MSKTHMNSQKLKQHAQSMHESVPGCLCIYHGFQLNVFMEFLSAMSGFLLVVLRSVCLVQLQCDSFFYFILFYFILRFFLNE